jgi:hypothetical protein
MRALILCAASAFLHWVLRENLRAEDRDTVADKIAVLRNILEERSDNLDALKEEVQWESTARKRSVYYARLLNEAGLAAPDRLFLLRFSAFRLVFG